MATQSFKREVWEVKTRSEKYPDDERTYYVFANNASSAEKRALKLAKEEIEYPRAYVTAAVFAHYVQ